MKNRIEYFLKHSIFAQKVLLNLASLLLRFIGLFINTNDRLILFTGHGGGFNDSPKFLYEFINKDSKFKDFTLIWGLSNCDRKPIGVGRCVNIDSFTYFIISLKAKYWISSVNIERGLRYKKKKTIYLNTWHGIPIKTIGNRAIGRNDYNFSHIDFFVFTSDYEKPIYINDLGVKKKSLLKVGMPRNERLFSPISKIEVNTLKKRIGIPLDKKIILYAPTWRESQNYGKNYEITPPINLDAWEKELSEDYILILRTHPYTNKLLGVRFNDFIIDVSMYSEVNDLLLISDILISDYSAISIDYSILERPIICFAYDIDVYKINRGLYMDLEKEFPGGVYVNEKDVLTRIKNIQKDESFLSEIKNFKYRFIETGEYSTATLIKYIFGGIVNEK